MTSPKKPSVAFWATVVVVVVLAAYPLSFGPACWLTRQQVGFPHAPPPHLKMPRAMIVYWPLGRLAVSKSQLGKPLRWWMTLGLPRGASAVVMTSLNPDYFICR
jgi:hypothetical protein